MQGGMVPPDMSKNNLEQMSNPMFLIQMVAQQ